MKIQVAEIKLNKEDFNKLQEDIDNLENKNKEYQIHIHELQESFNYLFKELNNTFSLDVLDNITSTISKRNYKIYFEQTINIKPKLTFR